MVELRNGEAASRVRKPQSPVNNLRNEEVQYRAKAKKGPQVGTLYILIVIFLNFVIYQIPFFNGN